MTRWFYRPRPHMLSPTLGRIARDRSMAYRYHVPVRYQRRFPDGLIEGYCCQIFIMEGVIQA